MENRKKGDFLEEDSSKGDIQVGEVQVREQQGPIQVSNRHYP